jgi:hypothetical protein
VGLTGRRPRQWLGTDDRYARLRRIETLNPETDSREIAALFYDDFQSVMLLQSVSGFLFTFAAPRMSRILSTTGQVEHAPGKRFVDTGLLFRYPLDHGFGPGPGQDAARRVNSMHRQYEIHPDDFVAVGCDVPLSAIDFAERLGWRAVTDAEREAIRLHFSHVARVFGSHRPLPASLSEMRETWDHYVDTQVTFEPQNRPLSEAMLDHVATLMPKPVRPFVTPLMLAQVDPRIVRACGLAVPSQLVKRMSDRAFHALGRRDPVGDAETDGLDSLAATVYPDGWTVDRLGTHPSGDSPPGNLE